MFKNNPAIYLLAVMDDDQEFDEGKHTQTEENFSREETRDGEH